MNTVLITGTTSGLGKAFAEKFAYNKDKLILVSRDENKLKLQKCELQEKYHVEIKTITCDLSKGDSVITILQKIKSWNIKVDFLINNAGFNECGNFVQTNLQKELEMISLHIRTVTELTKGILPDMLSNGYGRILNVGSTGSFIASPSDAVYSASKAYILSFSNALCGELSHTNVKITTLCPGATNTEFSKKAGLDNSLLFKVAVMNPRKVVDIAFSALLKGKRVVIPGLYNKFLVMLSKILPVSILNKATLIIMKK